MKHARGTAGGDLILFIFFIIVLGIVWSLTGGPERSISREGPFLNPPFPLGDGSAYTVPGVSIPSRDSVSSGSSGTTRSNKFSFADIIARIRGDATGKSIEKNSPYAGSVRLLTGTVRATKPGEEYIMLETSRDLEGRITISDWKLESGVSLITVPLGGAAQLPYSGQVNQENPVTLGADAKVYLVSGRSPIGVSFRTNTCTGYFAQFQDFEPKLKEECPQPDDELKNSIQVNFIPNDACISYVDRLRRCELTLTSVPQEVGSACADFILEDLTYNGCVSGHRNELDFYKNEWRVYLDRDQELWKDSNESIRLLDENGLVVDVLNY